MSERAVFLDRDNTIIENDGFLGDPSKVKLLPGAATALASIRGLGYRLIVVSNQSGVARGLFKEADVEAVNDEMSRQLKEKAGAYIDASYYCPYHPEAPISDYRLDHDWRKPKPGMLIQAAADFSLDLPQSWMIGDAPRDIAAGAAAGCRTILLRDPDKNPVSNVEAITVSPNFVVKSLADAARIIVREGRTHPSATAAAAPATGAATPSTAAAPATTGGAPISTGAKPVSTAGAPVSTAAAPLSTGGASSVAGESPETSAQLTLTAPSPDPAAMASAQLVAGQTTPETMPEKRAFSSAVPAAGRAEPKMPAGAKAEAGKNSVMEIGRMRDSNLERNLEELVIQLRNQNRNADLRPDFSYSTIAAIMCQLFAGVAFIVGLATYFTRTHSMATATDINSAIQAHLGAILWMGVAVFFQGGVITLLVYGRQKQG